MNPNSREYQTLKKTIYAEARGEPEEGQRWVAWVIKNRAAQNRGYWGGNTIEGVIRHPHQFEAWNGRNDIVMDDTRAARAIDRWLPNVFNGRDPTGGAYYYNNPAKEGYPSWTANTRRGRKIGGHQFYYDP